MKNSWEQSNRENQVRENQAQGGKNEGVARDRQQFDKQQQDQTGKQQQRPGTFSQNVKGQEGGINKGGASDKGIRDEEGSYNQPRR